MAKQGAFGLTWQITVSSTLTDVANLEDLKFPEPETETDEVTGHDSTGGAREHIAVGLENNGEFTALITLDTGEATHAELITLRGSGALNAMNVQDPSSNETLSFSAIVKKIARQGSIDSAWRAEVTCLVSGPITIT